MIPDNEGDILPEHSLNPPQHSKAARTNVKALSKPDSISAVAGCVFVSHHPNGKVACLFWSRQLARAKSSKPAKKNSKHSAEDM